MSFWQQWKSAKTLTDRLVDDARRQQDRYGDEYYEPPFDLPDDTHRLWMLISETDRIIRAATTVRAWLRQRLADQLGEGGAVRFGDTLIRYASTIDRKPTDTMKPYLESLEAADVVAILPTSGFRVSALRSIAARAGLDPDTLNGSMYVEERRPATITAIPVDHPRAPKYAADMQDGEIRRGNSNA